MPVGVKRKGQRYIASIQHAGRRYSLGGHSTIEAAMLERRAAEERIARGESPKRPRPGDALPKGVRRKRKSYEVSVYDPELRRYVYAGMRPDLESALKLRAAERKRIESRKRKP